MNLFTSKPAQKKFKVIKTFNDVNFDNNFKPLVICDIDHTFIRCSHNLDHFRKIINDDYKSLPNMIKNHYMENSDKEAIDLMNRTYNLGFIKQTDPEGFKIMLQNIERLNGKLIFLTARGVISHQKTINDFKRAGFENPEKFDIHYTNNEMTKGEYIKKTSLIDGYEHISFIDDYPSFLASVQDIFPQINCYLFTYD
jgi:hypothetical protein